MKLFNYILLFKILALAGIMGGMGWAVKNYLFYQKSIPAVGTVIKIAHSSYYDTKSHVMRNFYYPLIEFTANDGKKYQFYGSSSINMTGYDVDILYQAGHPEKAHVRDLTLWLYPSVTFFIGLIFMYVTYFNLKMERQMKRDIEEDARDLEDMDE